MSEPIILIVRPHRRSGGWEYFEAPGVASYWTGDTAKQNAIDYALHCRVANRHGELRIYNAAGEREETISFDERSGAYASVSRS